MIPSKESLASSWAALGNNRAFDPENVLELYDALTAGGRAERPLVASSPHEVSITGTTWQPLNLWVNMLPPNGGRGIKPYLVGEVWDGIHLEVEENGDGWWHWDANLSIGVTTQQVQYALRRTRDSVHTILQGIHVEVGFPLVGGPEDTFALVQSDLVSIVARTAAGQTAVLPVWSAALDAARRLSTT